MTTVPLPAAVQGDEGEGEGEGEDEAAGWFVLLVRRKALLMRGAIAAPNSKLRRSSMDCLDRCVGPLDDGNSGCWVSEPGVGADADEDAELAAGRRWPKWERRKFTLLVVNDGMVG